MLKQVQAKTINADAALRIIRRAQSKVVKIHELLHALGQIEAAPSDLRSQYRSMAKSLESCQLSPEQATVYGRLTLEFHALDQLLRESFYRED